MPVFAFGLIYFSIISKAQIREKIFCCFPLHVNYKRVLSTDVTARKPQDGIVFVINNRLITDRRIGELLWGGWQVRGK